jgi:exodeoxyribonuclease V alpha subunit
MKSENNAAILQHLCGSVERVTFHSEETGFCVLRAKVQGSRDIVTVLGSAANIAPGEYIECDGTWINDKIHGLQFKASYLKSIQPTTLDGIEKYLSSGMVKGIGRHFAKKLVQAFGVRVFDIIENEPNRLTELDGIGHKRKNKVTEAWAEQKAVRNIMVFLQTHGIGTARAVRIYKTYGDEAIAKVTENPYRLSLDIHGIGFKTADLLAAKLGIKHDALIRAQAGVRSVLQGLCDSGHCAAAIEHLIQASSTLLEINTTIIADALRHEIIEQNIVKDVINGRDCVYPAALFMAETKAAEHIKRLNKAGPSWNDLDITKAIPWVEDKTKIIFSASQRVAVETILKSKMAIVTGGPGVGKTTIVSSFVQIILAKKYKIALCAPTGRAAKRLMETTGCVAKTIHRLLDFDPKTFAFKYNQDNKLPYDLVVVDESSMLDIVLFNSFLKSLADNTAVIFVGDIDQLPSVGSGAVLSDLIKSDVITTVRLTEIFRQAADSKIITNAHRINNGLMPLDNQKSNSDFFTIYVETVEEIHAQLIALVTDRLPKHYKCDPIKDIQILTPMNRGGLGSSGINFEMQQKLNFNSEPKVTRYGITYAPGDKVIQITNNYDKEVFNGDIGFISDVDLEEGLVKIEFDKTIKEYELHELDEINLAYAISIHKSQGSEFPIVVIPLAMQHYALLARNLLYTGITRGKKIVILVGQKKAIGLAVSNNKETLRLTNLAHRVVG